MRYVSLKDAKPGMQLAYSLYDTYGRTLVGGNIRLTAGYIEKLEEYGFDGVYIVDAISEGIEVEPVISPEIRNSGMECVRNCDIDGCREIAKIMVSELLQKGSVSLDLMDLRSYDDYTYAHSVNVAAICGVIGLGMYLSEKALTDLVLAALLHDLGKLSIPAEILKKPGRLTPEEYQVMKTHSVRSYELISERWDISAKVKTAVLFHHENVDGSGYPRGLEGEKHTQFTRVLHVADVYDALTSKRPYKNPYSPQEVSEYLMGGCGTLFDKETVEHLLTYVPLCPKGMEIKLNDGRRGIVYENAGEHNLRPLIRLFSGDMLDLNYKDNLNVVIAPSEWQGEVSQEELERQRKQMIQPVSGTGGYVHG